MTRLKQQAERAREAHRRENEEISEGLRELRESSERLRLQVEDYQKGIENA